MLTTFLLLECTGAGAAARAAQDHHLATDLDDLRHGAPPPLSCQRLCCRQVRPNVANRLISSFSWLVQDHKLNLSTCFRSNLEDIRASHAACLILVLRPNLTHSSVETRAVVPAGKIVCTLSSPILLLLLFTSQQQLIAGKVDKYHLRTSPSKKNPGRGALSATES